jgi:phosphatidylserine/phosphatidylglycerophosphate/cardiolipin synthase-like enzyme
VTVERAPTPDASVAIALARSLPRVDVDRLAASLLDRPMALAELEARSGSAAVRDACRQLRAAITRGSDARVMAGALTGAAAAIDDARNNPRIDVVWTGPGSEVTTSRLTSEAIATMLDAARSEILLIGYAVHDQPRVAAALQDAAARGVGITLLLERHEDNSGYSSPHSPFGEVPATRLAWPRQHRPLGAALHAKVLVVDRTSALVGSANITGRALESNLECGILIRGGSEPAAICDHIASLRLRGTLTKV